MQQLYSEFRLIALRAQLKKRGLLLGCVALVFLALLVYSLVVRVQWLSTVALILFGACLIFGLDIFCLPIIRYARMVDGALHGRNHTDTLEYDHLEPDSSVVDGVVCRSLVFKGEPDKHGTRDQMYYWDQALPLPDFRPGQSVTLRYTGRLIIGYQV